MAQSSVKQLGEFFDKNFFSHSKKKNMNLLIVFWWFKKTKETIVHT